ncbi:hypothetical protein Trydic_g9686 [Trypoxylus dichotomus]
MKRCPTAALEIILHLTPLHIVVKGVVHAAMYRLTSAGTEGNETACQRAWSSREEPSPFLNLPNEEMGKKYSFKKNFLTKLSNKKNVKRMEGESSTNSLKANTVKGYTDGSKIHRGTGGPGTKYSKSMKTYPNVFQAEMNAENVLN